MSGTTAFSNSGTVFGTCSATGTASASGNWATTSGWGTTAVTAATGDSHITLVTLTNTVAGAASPVLTWTFPKAYPTGAPVSCVLTLVGGTGSGIGLRRIHVPGGFAILAQFLIGHLAQARSESFEVKTLELNARWHEE